MESKLPKLPPFGMHSSVSWTVKMRGALRNGKACSCGVAEIIQSTPTTFMKKALVEPSERAATLFGSHKQHNFVTKQLKPRGFSVV